MMSASIARNSRTSSRARAWTAGCALESASFLALSRRLAASMRLLVTGLAAVRQSVTSAPSATPIAMTRPASQGEARTWIGMVRADWPPPGPVSITSTV
jgi:hypothetical protein